MKKTIYFLFFINVIMQSYAGDTIKIMPVGNSITAGEHYNHPALNERTGYRKDLFDLLTNSGYNIDFVGSQNHGECSTSDTNWYDWNSESYPGWTIHDIAKKTNEALRLFFPDILLIHVGTNGSNWDEKPGEVMEMLDSINKFSVDNNHDVTIFLCKIINQYITQNQAPTSLFNGRVEELVNAREGDKIKIILVDMEKGAGLDYSDNLPDPAASPPYDGGDMLGTRYPGVSLDIYHPNEKGNYKMAVKFYKELVKELPKPEYIKN